MSRINSYPIDDQISGSDKWIGTDSGDNSTKNFTVNKVVSYLNDSNSIEADTLMFQYQDWESGTPRKPGSISFSVEQPSSVVPFSSISDFMLSQSELGKALDLGDFYVQSLIGSYIMISDIRDKNNFGIFQLNTISRDLIESEFFNVTVTPIRNSGNLTDEDKYFLSLVNLGIGNVDGNFVYTQSTESQTWIITHGLGKYASVTIVDIDKNIIYADVEYNSANRVTINFSKPVRGSAYIN